MIAFPVGFLRVPLAHRGLHDVAQGRPENSRAAFRAAIDAGYGIELDVQLSADGVAMVFHDYDLGRLIGRAGAVRGQSAEALGALHLIGGDEGIPTLAEICDLVAGRVPLLIEIKDQDGALGTNVGPLERAVAGSLREYPGPVAVMSFNPHSVAALRDLMPDIPRGLTTCGFDSNEWPVPGTRCADLRRISDFKRTEASFVSHDRRDLANPRVSELKRQGAAILCWTVRGPGEEAEARKVADNITFEGYTPNLA